MGTILTTQAGKTYKVIQSNIGLRVEFQNPDGTFGEILSHRPDENTAPEVVLNEIPIAIGGQG